MVEWLVELWSEIFVNEFFSQKIRKNDISKNYLSCSQHPNTFFCFIMKKFWSLKKDTTKSIKIILTTFYHIFPWWQYNLKYIDISPHFQKIIISYYILYQSIGLAVRVFINGPEGQSSIHGQVIPKTQKMVLDTSLLNTQHYKVWTKGKEVQSRKRSRIWRSLYDPIGNL